MKNFYPKSKGKIHPSPPPPTAAAAAAAASNGDPLSVLKLLPAAIFVLTAALAFEDKEVVAYLMIRSVNGSGPAEAAGDEGRRCRRIAGVHSPLFDCGCFDCYTCFWSRWDCSKDREVIHMVIEAFEEHLASKEKKGKEAKRKRKKSKDEKREKGKEKEKEKERDDNEKMAEVVAAEENKGLEEEAVSLRNGCFTGEEEEAVSLRNGCFTGEEEVERDEDKEGVSGREAEFPAVSGERRRGWTDVVGMLNSRLWSLWSPGV